MSDATTLASASKAVLIVSTGCSLTLCTESASCDDLGKFFHARRLAAHAEPINTDTRCESSWRRVILAVEERRDAPEPSRTPRALLDLGEHCANDVGDNFVWQEKLIEKIRNTLEQDAKVLGLFLGGSFGKGQADAYSDVDLLAVVARDDQAEFGRRWRQQLEAIAPIVFWNELHKEERVINAITEEWQRVDLLLSDEEAIRKRSKDSLKPLIDRHGLYGTLPTTIQWPGPNRGYLLYLINEFLRVFGLLAVVNGRREYLLSMAGVDLLRMMLFNLLSEEVERVDKGGMLSWSRRLSAEQLGLLATIPPVAPTRQSVVDAHLACAAAFLPRARKMAKRWNIEWPQAFEDATWKHLEREVGLKRPASVI